jgi:hypothetical protein
MLENIILHGETVRLDNFFNDNMSKAVLKKFPVDYTSSSITNINYHNERINYLNYFGNN